MRPKAKHRKHVGATGTYHACLPSILCTGLSKMARNHIHFAAGLPESDGVISGMRSTSEVKRSPFYPRSSAF